MKHTLTLLTALLLTPLLCAANEDNSTVDTKDKHLKTLVVANKAGLRWELSRTKDGWSLGGISFHEKPLEQPATNGLLALRNVKRGEVRWMAASKEEMIDPQTARLSGQEAIDGVIFSYTVTVDLSADMPAARLTAAWSVDKDLNDWEVCLAYHDGFANDWRVQSYPWAGNSEKVAISPMRYCGVPGVLVYRPDQSLVALFAIDKNSDYLNPTTWTGKTDFHFANRSIAPQFRMGGGKLAAGIKYEIPLQLFLSDAGGFPGAITGIMQAWIKLNNYRVDDSLKVRMPQEAFVLALEGRRNMESWKPGVGYEHHKGTPFVYVGNNPFIAYYEYRQYEITGDQLWRDRAFEQIDFAIKGQQTNGVFHTSWYFRQAVPEFCSRDWGHDGYKVDINVWMARYLLQTWQRVKEEEGIDRQDWYKAAIASLEWVKSQQNQDGGLPQCVDTKTGKKSFSVVCGRALVGLPIIARITGDERYLKLSADMEKFLRKEVEDRFWYTGMHPDLPPGDFEQDSVYAVVEYWLDKHDRTGDRESLDHAVANAYYGLLYWCPKQLSWVKSPTQGAHSEQQHFNQYSVYCYGNRKIQCLDRLFKKTANPLFEQLKNRVMQLNFHVQVADGPYQGAMTEAIADPWLERNQGFEWRGNPYTSELVADLMLQLIDMGLVSPRGIQSRLGASGVRLPTNDPAKPERPNDEWRMRHAERVADVRSHAAKLDVLFVGDSITGGWRDIGKAIWEKEFIPLHAVNIGIAGSQTQHLLWQFENGAIDGINPRLAVVMIGVNHLLASPSHSPADIARGISTVIAKLREKLPHTKVLLLGTFPKDKSPASPDRIKIRELNSLIAKLDDGKNVQFVDLTPKFLDAEGLLSPEISPDGVHLSPAGYAVWGDQLKPILNDVLGKMSIHRHN